MIDFKLQVKQSFINVKEDIETLKIENLNLKHTIKKFEEQNLELIKKLDEISKKLDTQPKIETVKPKVAVVENKKNSYDALLEFKAKINKKEIIKQKILVQIGELGTNLNELKFMIVEHFKYCSKATFYNYLKELEIEKRFILEKKFGKIVVYLSGVVRNSK